MIIVFEKDYLEKLYTEGKAKGKKYRYPKGLICKYKQTIDKLRLAKQSRGFISI